MFHVCLWVPVKLLGPHLTYFYDAICGGNSNQIGSSNYSRLEPDSRKRLHARQYLAFPETRSADAVNTKWRHT
jgi:hypothetical protein